MIEDPTNRRAGPLAGITVVALEQAVSAPMCSRTLADLGARVIKVESPAGGDFTRHYDAVVGGMAAHFVWLNRGKESIALDLRSDAGREVMDRLLARADAFVSNLSPSATSRMGLGSEQLRENHPHLVSVEISGFGPGGPMSHKRAYDLLIQAESGACAITGWEGMPAKAGPPVADVTTGLYAAITILSMLIGRRSDGAGGAGDAGVGGAATVSMLDTMVELMGYALTHARYSGQESPPVGMGSPAVAPYSAYPTADDQVVLLGTTNNAEWARLAALICRPELAVDPRYADNADRVARRSELDELIAAWCAGRKLAEIQSLADEAGIGNGRYNTPSDVLSHPHLEERGRWLEHDSPVGPVVVAAPPPVIDGQPFVAGRIPGLGEHTDLVLAELGYRSEEIAALRDQGVAVRVTG